MKIICDSREQLAFTFGGYGCEVQAGTLTTGDYSLAGLEDRCAVERKSLDDLLGCLIGEGRERFERELARAAGLECFAVVVEASMQDMAEGRYRSRMKPHAALQSVLAFQVRHGCPFLWCGNRTGAEYATYHFLRHYLREASTRYKSILEAHGPQAA
ncbi:ERCC4 domain-containing protein [Humidesulfovibrio mexicanus]|uniref:ERCC4 domain-containing protein n=1 Tax=Humidesulfovibrio mexicanus TaxID=147047 RepID=A0A238ZE40_9BACT|nr:ERCC4 domain-containing protein [Humidesulfovibrio mexicanus]SNR81550.1 ERCC4 domain-containing protein [Humidesulfovibrio mexicanus]